MRYEGNKVVITESELRWLVNETANSILNENEVGEGAWGGWKNAWRGAFGRGADGRNYNFNLGQTYRAGRDASSFAKYAQQADKAIQGMRAIASSKQGGGNENISNALNTVASNIQSVSQEYQKQAQNVANGNAKRLGQVSNPWSKTQKFDAMKAERDKLQQQYSDLQTQNNQLQGDYNDVQDRYRALQGDYGARQKDYDALKGEYDKYRKDNPAKQKPYTSGSKPYVLGNGSMGNKEYDAAIAARNAKLQQQQAEEPKKPSIYQRIKNGVKDGLNWVKDGVKEIYNDEDENESIAPRKVMPESRMITVSEDYIRDLVNETLKVLKEDGEAGGGGATNAAGVMQGGGTNPGAGTYDAPAFGGKNKKKVGGNAFSEPIMRQKHNLGDVTSAPANQVDMKPALKRGGSIAMGESRRRR